MLAGLLTNALITNQRKFQILKITNQMILVFVLYAAPFVLQDIPPDQYQSFMCHHQGISLLENQKYIDKHSEYAH